MENKLKIKRCMSCGAIVKVIEDCNCENCGIVCCGEVMNELIPNSVDAAVEKHVPTYEVTGDRIKVKVNHVMEEEHYIEWISLLANNKEIMIKLNPGEDAEADLPYISGSIIYAYCNKHGLWKKEVE